MRLWQGARILVVLGITLSLVIPGLLFQPSEPRTMRLEQSLVRNPQAPAAPDAPRAPPVEPVSNWSGWENISATAGEGRPVLNDSLLCRNVTLDELRVLAGAEASSAQNGTTQSQNERYGSLEYNEGSLMMGGLLDYGDVASAPRMVEEADIVKLQGDHIYVLNSYKGLIIIDLSRKDTPVITGSLLLHGYPKEMYISGDLAFVLMSMNYGYWYNYYTRMEGGAALDLIDGVKVTLGTDLAVIDLSNKSAPRLQGKFPLPGYASDSRRVGDVIYIASSYSETGPNGTTRAGTVLTSVDFHNPAAVRRVDRLFINGSSNIVHASSTAFFISRTWHEHTAGKVNYLTCITYFDISDPYGRIRPGANFTAQGTLRDKYQIDHHGATLRIVTHFPMQVLRPAYSRLSIFDVRDPGNINQLGALDISDAGTLMATRFDGDRAYTIHLPGSVDPLDVLDLSDPRNPRLMDVLEIPGWVTHIEVRGRKLIALGINDTANRRQAAVSLFDVRDAANAVLKARIPIGDGSSWSVANSEPKALTVVDSQGLVVVPFRPGSSGAGKGGVQLVGFDLVNNTLSDRGAVLTNYTITRSRAFGDRLIATSDEALQGIDPGRGGPAVKSVIEFLWNVEDAAPMGRGELQLVRNEQNNYSLRYCADPSRPWAGPLSCFRPPLERVKLFPNGNIASCLGIAGKVLKVISYDYSDPAVPRETGNASAALPEVSKTGASRPAWTGTLDVRLLPGNILVVIVRRTTDPASVPLFVFNLSAPSKPALVATFQVDLHLSAKNATTCRYNDLLAAGRFIFLRVSNYDSGLPGYKYFLCRLDLSDPAVPVRTGFPDVQGTLLGADPDGLAVYTCGYSRRGNYTFARYSLKNGLSLDYAVVFNRSITSGAIQDGRAYLTLYNSRDTTLCVLDIRSSPPRPLGKVVIDGRMTIRPESSSRLYLSGSGLLAAFDRTGDSPVLAGALPIRERVMTFREFDRGALVSEGFFGTEVLAF